MKDHGNSIALTVNDTVQATGISRTSLYKLFKTGKLTPRKHGSRTYILVSELKEFMESLPVSS